MRYFKYIIIWFIIFIFTGCAKNHNVELTRVGGYNKMKTYLDNGGNPEVCITQWGKPLPKSSCNLLAQAAWHNNLKVLKLLVEHGADASTNTEVDKCTLLGRSILNGNQRMAKYLIDNGARKVKYYTNGLHRSFRDSSSSCGLRQEACDTKEFVYKYLREIKYKQEIKRNKEKQNTKNNELDTLLGI